MKKKTILPLVVTTLTASAAIPATACSKSELLDYSNSNNWMIKEDYGSDSVDVFYLYPTVSSDTEREVTKVDDAFKKDAYKNTTGNIKCLDPIANIYAPYYHQLTAGGIAKCPTATDMYNMIKNNEYIKQDVFNALDYYFTHFNNNKPYILASHSQGSVVMQIVLEEYMKKHQEYYSRMVCAYTLGMNYTQDYANRNSHVKFATGEKDTGVVVTWNTFGVGATPGYTIRIDEKPCGYINPITWAKNEEESTIEQHKGGYDASTGGCTSSFITCKLDLSKHLLIVNDDKWNDTYKAMYPAIPKLYSFFGNKSYHFEDWRLFAGNIRENAKKRIEAFVNK